MAFADLFLAGCCAHAIGDWFLQNEWIALNKTNLRHPAAWIHGAQHTLLLCFVFPWSVALTVGALHMLIDTRAPLSWWRRTIRQTVEGPMAIHVAIWQDQAAHGVVLALAAWMVAH